ncbi:aminoglycoside phosphotransferase (APT) family kinase protein [Agromyces terreus]|uniref:Aminoglycoside phosphotransferase (APT) family kinase protein n=1 Tax=Agromyces terreus TaxID=424795 RepID=A0A9X2KB15_9MICO|nr:phosphotransferase family protein [Agromyces terreus]MCP2370943.1 aminoglycoside phosphotransferase (APT) family kinase protein [Agromyces terreus]
MTDTPGLNLAGFSAWLAEAHPELVAATPAAPLTATLIAGGRSNLTYRVDGPAVPLIVRRPPLGHVLASAHDMGREHRVISALAGSGVPVPPAVDLVDDSEAGRVTGTAFFVMRVVEGVVLASPRQNADYTPAGLHGLGLAFAETLARLHAVDAASVGLADFGRPDGYLDRQLRTWRRQLEASRSRDLPELDRLQQRLEERMPPAGGIRSGIVHGDYRLDNAIIAGPADAPRIAAILDWEMATLGDPLVDLGMLGMYWNIASLAPDAVGLTRSAVDPAAGYPEFDELVDCYAHAAGIRTPDLTWYRAFAAYKLAVILEGIHYRYRQGQTLGEGFDRIGQLVEPLASTGLSHTTDSPTTPATTTGA